jgi:hypothetical protein
MKNSFLKSTVLKNRWRCGVLLFAVLCLVGSGFTLGSAQLKNRKRVTALQLGDSAEGARVTILSDSALNDYEAFRRGDRFYVKIPVADFATTLPGFRGDGFDDVQVQTVGDTVVISFKLQPGASARVDQRANRLDVVFSAPNRIARNNSSAVFNRVSSNATTGINRVNSSTTTTRSGDNAGPVPPSTSQAYRERLVTARQGDGQAAPNARGSSRKSVGSSTVANSSTGKSTSQSSTPSSTLPSATPYVYQPSATPLGPVSSQTSVNSSGTANSQGSRGQTVRDWVSAHRMQVGVAVALAALLLLAALLYRRRDTVVKSKAGKEPRVQPKYSPDIALNDSLAADAKVSSTSRPVSNDASTSESTATSSQTADEYKIRPVAVEATAPAIPTLSPNVSRTSTPEPVESSRAVPEPALAGSFGVEPSNYARVLSSPSISSPVSGDDPFFSEDQDREVFEL